MRGTKKTKSAFALVYSYPGGAKELCVCGKRDTEGALRHAWELD